MKTSKKIVVKVGTSTLTQGSKQLSRKYMLELARQLAHLHEKGDRVILVTSGAVATGRELCQAGNHSQPTKQMFSAIGQVRLMEAWMQLFSLFEIHVGQLLLTRDDFTMGERHRNTSHTLECLLTHRIVPIINENDSIAIAENRIGDNDNLAALVAGLVGADLLVLLTDQQGLYTADPRMDPAATLIPVVDMIDEQILKLARGSSTTLGTGGMITKLQAAAKATEMGIPTVIASAGQHNVLLEISNGKQVGTSFLANKQEVVS